MAAKLKREEQTEQSLHTVKDTWEPVLQRFPDLPNDWVHHCEVLVGRRTRRPVSEGHVT
jgi:hypothetical protein